MTDPTLYEVGLDNVDLETDYQSISSSSAEKILGTTAWKILKILKRGPMYSKELKKQLKRKENLIVSEQSIYYHLRRLEDREIVEKLPESYEAFTEKRIIHVNRYQLAADVFLINIPDSDNNNEKSLNLVDIGLNGGKLKPKTFQQVLPSFLEFFSDNFVFDGWIVPGSPLRHGSNDAIATDGHFAAQVAFLLGKYLAFPSHIIVKWDTDIIKEQKTGENLILLGGPFVNLIINDINKDDLLVKFLLTKDSCLKIVKTGREIHDEFLGVIQLITNPYNPKKSILVIGGPKRRGTESAAVAITKYAEKVETELLRTGSYCVVQGKTDNWDEITEIDILQL